MIFRECPNCNELIINHMPERTPAFTENTCEHCKKPYWMKYSRLDPVAYTVDNFLKEFDVNAESKTIKLREGK